MARIFLKLENVFRVLAGCILMVVMFIVVADVLLRYAFNAPLIWAHDFISLYFMVALFYLTLSWSYADRHHINVDLLYRVFPPKLRNLCRGLFSLASCVVFALIGWKAAELALAGYQRGDMLSGPVPLPTWVPGFIAAFGCALFVLRLLMESLAMFAALGRHEDETDPLAGTQS